MLKDEALQIVSDDGFCIKYLPQEFQQDIDVILTALKQSLFSIVNIDRINLTHNILTYLFDNQYQEYYDNILDIIYNTDNKNILQNFDYNLKNNRKLIEILCVIESKTIRHASEEILNDKVFFLNILKKYCGKYYKILKYLSPNLRDDEEIVSTLINIPTYTFELEYASDRLKSDYNFILNSVKKNGDVLQFANKKLRCNRKILLEAVKNDGCSLKYTNYNLKNNEIIVLEAVKNDGHALQYANNRLRNNRKFVLEAVKNEGMALKYASEILRNDCIIVLNAVNNNYNAIQYASETLINNTKIVLKAIKNDRHCHILRTFHGINDNQKIISNAVKYNYVNFSYASDRLKTNEKFILYLTKININIIKYLSQELLVKILLKIDINNENIHVFRFISSSLLDNKELMLVMLKKNYQIFNYMSHRLKNDEDLLCIIIKYTPDILSEPYFKNKFSNKIIFEILKLDLFLYLPTIIQTKYEDLEKIYNNKEINIDKLFDIVFKNIDNFIDNKNVINKIFKENLEKFINIWYKSKSIRNKLFSLIENNEKFSALLFNEYDIIFENIKIFDETLDIDNINDEKFINIKNIHELHIKKKVIYY